MATKSLRARSGAAWALAQRQHGALTRRQLLGLGMSGAAIRHRVESGRLHPVHRGVYAVGRPELGERGRCMAAVLAGGRGAVLSHWSAAALLGIGRRLRAPIEVTIPAERHCAAAGVRIHRRAESPLPGHTWVAGIPVTTATLTLVDIAAAAPLGRLEAAVNEADHLGLVDPETLRASLDGIPRRPGLSRLRQVLDRSTTALAASELERRFLRLVERAGLPMPRTQTQLGPYRVDFLWDDLGLVVETDSLRYHRTAFAQAVDKKRDNANAARGLLTLRFTHTHIRHEPEYVRGELRAAVTRFGGERGELVSL